jgi:hypothetical protein
MRVAGFSDIIIRGDRVRLKLRPQRIAWWVMNRLWYSLLGLAYYIERGMDRPKTISRALIVTGKRQDGCNVR